MFKALATVTRSNRHGPDVDYANDNHVKHASYMIFRDGRPFLEVNGSSEYVTGLLVGFQHQAPAHWTAEQIA